MVVREYAKADTANNATNLVQGSERFIFGLGVIIQDILAEE